MYKNEEEFVELVKYYLNNKDEREEKAKKAQEITIKRFGGQKVLGDMMKIIEDYIAKNKDVIN
jgi:spore maturation protein CgeB